MNRITVLTALITLLAACSAPVEMQVQVKPLGENVAEASGAGLYYLPRTVLMVELTYEETMDFPGPYGDYAARYLGLEEVIEKKSTRYRITDVRITPYSETDHKRAFRLHVKEGSFPGECLAPYLEKGLICDGSLMVQRELEFTPGESGTPEGIVRYLDLGTQGNFGERTETMYKTIVTDTSFVEVPVTRTIMEEKSLVKKAEEAADFILELRTRRFEMLTGEYDLYPEGEAMASALKKMDELESSYLSLFTGKTVSGSGRKAWFVIPEEGQAASSYRLSMFSGQLGFVPEELQEGLPIELRVEPESFEREAYSSVSSDTISNNLLFYRIPVVSDLKISWGDEVLEHQRISIFQSGTMVTAPF